MLTLEELRRFATPRGRMPDGEVLAWDGELLRLRRIPDAGELRDGGVVSGPALVGYVDHAAFLAVIGLCGTDGRHATTVSLTAEFLRRAPNGPTILETRVLRNGRRLIVTDTLLYAEGDPAPIARVGMTYTNPSASRDWMAANAT